MSLCGLRFVFCWFPCCRHFVSVLSPTSLVVPVFVCLAVVLFTICGSFVCFFFSLFWLSCVVVLPLSSLSFLSSSRHSSSLLSLSCLSSFSCLLFAFISVVCSVWRARFIRCVGLVCARVCVSVLAVSFIFSVLSLICGSSALCLSTFFGPAKDTQIDHNSNIDVHRNMVTKLLQQESENRESVVDSEREARVHAIHSVNTALQVGRPPKFGLT